MLGNFVISVKSLCVIFFVRLSAAAFLRCPVGDEIVAVQGVTKSGGDATMIRPGIGGGVRMEQAK